MCVRAAHTPPRLLGFKHDSMLQEGLICTQAVQLLQIAGPEHAQEMLAALTRSDMQTYKCSVWRRTSWWSASMKSARVHRHSGLEAFLACRLLSGWTSLHSQVVSSGAWQVHLQPCVWTKAQPAEVVPAR